MGLEESYYVIRGQILVMDLILDINKALSLVVQEEKQETWLDIILFLMLVRRFCYLKLIQTYF